MILDSLSFLFFFLPIFIIVYFLAPQRMRNTCIFLGSLVFCAFGNFIVAQVMLLSVILDYFCARVAVGEKPEKFANFCLGASISAHILVLVYALWETQNMGNALPIFIFTLISVSYIMDIYRKKISVQRNFFDFGACLCFFPILTIGPIPEYETMEKQLRNRKVDPLQIQKGIKKFIRGLAKKVVIAGRMELLWQEIREIPYGYMTTAHAWLGVLTLGFLVYFTLSGLSDMAIGLAGILGFTLPENFDYPIKADSVKNYFDRFCLTITKWFQEYIYAPICRKEKLLLQFLATIITWVVIGIWIHEGKTGILVAVWFGLWIALENLFLLRVKKVVPFLINFLCTQAVVLLGMLVLVLPRGEVMPYLEQLLTYGAGEIYNGSVIYLLMKYGAWLLVAVLSSQPIFHSMTGKMRKANTGGTIGFYRILNKLVPAGLLILTMIYMM